MKHFLKGFFQGILAMATFLACSLLIAHIMMTIGCGGTPERDYSEPYTEYDACMDWMASDRRTRHCPDIHGDCPKEGMTRVHYICAYQCSEDMSCYCTCMVNTPAVDENGDACKDQIGDLYMCWSN